MKLVSVLLLFLSSTSTFAEDVQVREEAVRLLEKANAVSAIANFPNLERVDTFRAYSNDTVQDGIFTRVVIQGTGRRDEITFGTYHVLDIWASGHLATVRTNDLAPPEVMDLQTLTPIHGVRFDEEDVIRKIVDRDSGGKPSRCIEFDTVAGSKSQANELCMDATNGVLVSERLFGDLIENGNFFSFAGALLPGKITYFKNGVLQMEITQTMTPLNETDANVLIAPPNADIRELCKTFRRAFGQFMPQPKAGNGGTDTDVLVRALIAADGKVRHAVVQDSSRPDLNSEALSLVQQWSFTPQVCNGKPSETEANFTLHFQGR